MTQITSHQAAQKIGKGTAEKMSLQATKWLQETSRDDVDVTLRGSSSQTRVRGNRKSSVADSRQPCTTDDQWWWWWWCWAKTTLSVEVRFFWWWRPWHGLKLFFVKTINITTHCCKNDAKNSRFRFQLCQNELAVEWIQNCCSTNSLSSCQRIRLRSISTAPHNIYD